MPTTDHKNIDMSKSKPLKESVTKGNMKPRDEVRSRQAPPPPKIRTTA